MCMHAIQSNLQCWRNSYSWNTRVYVAINAFRAMFPVKPLERQCLTPFSSPVMDRSVATVGELLFAIQLVHTVDDVEPFIFLYAVFAQVFCWIAITTQDNLYHVYEECLWLLIGLNYAWYSPIYYGRRIAAAYCVYMILSDIPMYALRPNAPIDWERGTQSIHECVVNHTGWEVEKIWRTGYFVGATRAAMYMDGLY